MHDTRMTSVLTGAIVSQLQFWRKRDPNGAFLTPLGSKPGERALYSFEDVVALRMFARLATRGQSAANPPGGLMAA